MKKIHLFINLTRLDKPTGILLLFWPCLWGLTLAYEKNQEILIYLNYIFLFFIGSVLMRSAGCIVNDIVDKKYDKKVARTKSRPIASEKISIINAAICSLFLCTLAFLVLIQFNFLTIILGLSSMFLAFSYPYMKRLTYWPQLFLGLTFNWGIIMAWASLKNSISIDPIILYISAIFWTLGYDTIYGLQDTKDDEIIGLKSTSIKFKKNVKIFVGTCYGIFVSLLLLLFFIMEIEKYFYLLVLVILTQLFHQIQKFDAKDEISCMEAFKSNNLVGFFVFIIIGAIKFI